MRLTIDGETITGRTPAELVKAMRAGSFAPCDDLRTYMRAAAARAEKQYGTRPRADSAKRFVNDLVEMGAAALEMEHKAA